MMDIAAETAKAMARPLSGARRRAADRFRHFDAAPISDDVLAAGEYQDAAAESGAIDVGEFDPDDRWDRPQVPDWDRSL